MRLAMGGRRPFRTWSRVNPPEPRRPSGTAAYAGDCAEVPRGPQVAELTLSHLDTPAWPSHALRSGACTRAVPRRGKRNRQLTSYCPDWSWLGYGRAANVVVDCAMRPAVMDAEREATVGRVRFGRRQDVE